MKNMLLQINANAT